MHQIGGIILSPTRELALQTYEVVKQFADVAPSLKAMLMTGEPRAPASGVMRTQHPSDDCTHDRHVTSTFACISIGGTDPKEDVDHFQKNGANILVATPGRLAALLERVPTFAAGIKSLEIFIMDEADRLLDMGFERELNQILVRLPKQRRTVRGGSDPRRTVEYCSR